MPLTQMLPLLDWGDHIHKFGYNADVDASTGSDEDIIAAGGEQYFPASVVAAADIDIASSDAADDAAGTGARTLFIQGVDADYMLQSEIVELDGTTDVHPTKNYLRIFRAYVVTAGSGGTNAGNIQIDDGAGNVFAYIPAGYGQTLQAAYTIPADYTNGGYMLQWYVAIDSKIAAYVNACIQVREYGGAWQTKEVIGVSADGPLVYTFAIPIHYPAKADIRLRILDASADNLLVSGGFDLLLRR